MDLKYRLHRFFVRATLRDWLKRTAYAIGIGAAVLVVAVVITHQWYSQSLRAVNPQNDEEVVFVVAPGNNASTIGKNLEKQQLIRSGTAFRWYVERQNLRTSLQAGTYALSQAQTTQEIANIIAEGLVDSEHVTILPGQRLDEIRVWLEESGFAGQNINEALSASYDHPILSDKPKNRSLEGYIFPDTYEINSQTTVQQLIQKSFDSFQAKITPEIKQGIQKQGLSFHQAVILASIIQKESSEAAVQPTIAQVFLRRLKENVELGSDVTFIYAATIEGVEPSVSIDSPYNTRIHKGLPPGPIGNFNLSALEAVAKPDTTDYLYFVAGDDGHTYFSHTQAEHERLTEEHCKKLCSL